MRDADELLQRCFIRIATCLLSAHRRHACWQRSLIISEQLHQVRRAFRLNAVLESLIDVDGVGQLQHLLLISGLIRSLGWRARRLSHDFFHRGFDLVVAVVTQARFLDAFVAELQLADQIGMMDQKHSARVSHLWLEEYFQQPLGGFEFLGMPPELP